MLRNTNISQIEVRSDIRKSVNDFYRKETMMLRSPHNREAKVSTAIINGTEPPMDLTGMLPQYHSKNSKQQERDKMSVSAMILAAPHIIE